MSTLYGYSIYIRAALGRPQKIARAHSTIIISAAHMRQTFPAPRAAVEHSLITRAAYGTARATKNMRIYIVIVPPLVCLDGQYIYVHRILHIYDIAQWRMSESRDQKRQKELSLVQNHQCRRAHINIQHMIRTTRGPSRLARCTLCARVTHYVGHCRRASRSRSLRDGCGGGLCVR